MTEYGKKVKIRLIEEGMTQIQLMNKINEKTGLHIDDGYMYKILNGKRNSPRVVGAINEILGIST